MISASPAQGGLHPGVEVELRTCPHCARSLPITDFKRRSVKQGGGPSWCKPCINAAASERRRRKRTALVNGLGRTLRLKSPATRAQAVLEAFARRIGGCEAAGKALAENWNLAFSGHDRRTRQQAITLIFKLVSAGND